MAFLSPNGTNIRINIGSYVYIYNKNSSGTIVKSFSVDAIHGQTFTGSKITPSVTLKFRSTTLKKDTDYTVSYGSNINSGTNAGSVTITGIGFNYKTITKTYGDSSFNINDSVDKVLEM